MTRGLSNSSLQSFWLILFCAFWSGGVISGIIFFTSTYSCEFLLGRLLPTVSPSLSSLLMIRFGILLASIFLLRYCRFVFLVLVISVSFSYGILLSSIFCAFGSAAWLVSLLILAPDVVLLISFVYYGISRSVNLFRTVKKDIIVSFVVICTVSIVECCYIAPFTSALF